MQQNLLSVLVSNHFGVLMRVTTIFSRRTCNINSLTVAETQDPKLSRITILFEADKDMAAQILKLLEKQEDVVGAVDLPLSTTLLREVILVKVKDSPHLDADLAAFEKAYHAKILSRKEGACVVEFVADSTGRNDFYGLMEQYGIIEVCRTGAAAMADGLSNIYQPQKQA